MLKVYENNNIKIKREIDGKINFYSCCIKSLKLLIKKNQVTYWKFKLYIKQCYQFVWSVEKKTECKNPRVAKANKGKLMLLSKWPLCNSTKSRFIKKQEASGLLSNLEPKTTLSKILLFGDTLFRDIKWMK